MSWEKRTRKASPISPSPSRTKKNYPYPPDMLREKRMKTDWTFPPTSSCVPNMRIFCIYACVCAYLWCQSIWHHRRNPASGGMSAARRKRREIIPEHRLNYVASRSLIEFGNSPLVYTHLRLLNGADKKNASAVSPIRLQVRMLIISVVSYISIIIVRYILNCILW